MWGRRVAAASGHWPSAHTEYTAETHKPVPVTIISASSCSCDPQYTPRRRGATFAHAGPEQHQCGLGTLPSPPTCHCRPWENGANETSSFDPAQGRGGPGTWYILERAIFLSVLHGACSSRRPFR